MPDEGQMRFTCPNCGKVLKAKPSQAGRAATCPTCKASMQIPGNRIVTPQPPKEVIPAKKAGPALPSPRIVNEKIDEPLQGAKRAKKSDSEDPAKSRREIITGAILIGSIAIYLLITFGLPTFKASLVDGSQFFSDYSKNPAAADAKYKGNRVQININVEEIEAHNGNYAAVMNGRRYGYPFDLACMMTSSDAPKVQRGRSANIEGRCDGFSDGIIWLSDCTVTR